MGSDRSKHPNNPVTLPLLPHPQCRLQEARGGPETLRLHRVPGVQLLLLGSTLQNRWVRQLGPHAFLLTCLLSVSPQDWGRRSQQLVAEFLVSAFRPQSQEHGGPYSVSQPHQRVSEFSASSTQGIQAGVQLPFLPVARVTCLLLAPCVCSSCERARRASASLGLLSLC